MLLTLSSSRYTPQTQPLEVAIPCEEEQPDAALVVAATGAESPLDLESERTRTRQADCFVDAPCENPQPSPSATNAVAKPVGEVPTDRKAHGSMQQGAPATSSLARPALEPAAQAGESDSDDEPLPDIIDE